MRIMDVTTSAHLLKMVIHISIAVIVGHQMDFGVLEITASLY